MWLLLGGPDSCSDGKTHRTMKKELERAEHRDTLALALGRCTELADTDSNMTALLTDVAKQIT